MSIVVNNLCHIYHDGTALRSVAIEGISLTIENGSWVSIIGHTGSGKSTFAQHLNAILRPTSGSICVDGETILPHRKREKCNFRNIRRRVGLVFQYPEQQLFEETVKKEISFAPRNWGISEGDIPSLISRSLVAVGLDDSYLERNPFGLSGGEKRRVAIASVLACSPDYLVLDEPTAGLDGRARKSLLKLLDKINKDGTAVILVTHDLEIAFSRSDKVLILEHGHSVGFGSPSDIALQLSEKPVPGLVLPPVMRVAIAARKQGWKLPVTCDAEKLANSFVRERRRRG